MTMSSGTLELNAYYRQQFNRDDNYKSVVTVYNDVGEKFASKSYKNNNWELDNEDESIPVDALREISILRLLRKDNGHPNIISIHDIKLPVSCEEECSIEDGWCNQMGFIMPKYEHGTLSGAIEMGHLYTKEHQIQIAHGILSAVAYLHENGIIHRDINGHNVLISFDETNNAIKPILIDFSLAKLIGHQVYGLNDDSHSYDSNTVVDSNGDGITSCKDSNIEDIESKTECTHTSLADVEFAYYHAPEVVCQEIYSFPSDIWSVGILLLELVNNETLSSSSNFNKNYDGAMKNALKKIPFHSPFGKLLRGLLKENPDHRLTAREALQSTLFSQHQEPSSSKVIQIDIALPLVSSIRERNAQNTCDILVSHFQPQVSVNHVDEVNLQIANNNVRCHEVLEDRMVMIREYARELNCQHPLTIHAAWAYSIQLEQLEEDIDNVHESQALLDCVILAYKFFEQSANELDYMEHDLKKNSLHFANWNKQDYINSENALWMLMDFCLFPRHLIAF